MKKESWAHVEWRAFFLCMNYDGMHVILAVFASLSVFYSIALLTALVIKFH